MEYIRFNPSPEHVKSNVTLAAVGSSSAMTTMSEKPQQVTGWLNRSSHIDNDIEVLKHRRQNNRSKRGVGILDPQRSTFSYTVCRVQAGVLNPRARLTCLLPKNDSDVFSACV